MPFISVRVSQNTATVPFIQFNAGQDQNVLCAEIVELEAVVLQGDINDHIFEWEQLDGTPVLLENANTLSPWFINPNTTDFVFRFWVDRNTPFERFSDVFISRNPADTVTNLLGSSSSIGNNIVTTENVAFTSNTRNINNVTVMPTSFSDNSGTVILNDARFSSADYMVFWSPPSDATNPHVRYLGTEAQFWNTITNEWEVETAQPAGTNYVNISANRTYRIVTVWQSLSTGIITKQAFLEYYREKASRENPQFVTGSSLVTTLLSSGYVNIGITKTIFNPARIICSELDPVTNLLYSSTNTTNITSAIFRAVGSIDSREDLVTSLLANSSAGIMMENLTTISRANGISIGV